MPPKGTLKYLLITIRDESVESLDPWPVRRFTPRFVAAAPENGHFTIVGDGGKLFSAARLSDSRLA